MKIVPVITGSLETVQQILTKNETITDKNKEKDAKSITKPCCHVIYSEIRLMKTRRVRSKAKGTHINKYHLFIRRLTSHAYIKCTFRSNLVF